MHGVILNEWDAARTLMPERTYKLPKGAMPIRYTRTHCDYFPPDRMELYSKGHRERLARTMIKFRDFAEHPAKYGVAKSPPRILDKNYRGVVNHRVGRNFGWDKRTSWDGFKKMFLNRTMPKTTMKSISMLQ
eukprot:TRINITY_DN15144_c0_g1_i1.p1 TRINITY_DN15144_c0_g1~~TRINITY_DN15144_c0_g1_i1.p1  ORF type:complete len:132 (+),score=35.12 TRINITY_DN15144_c0_g1_i1:346-741(+)